MASFPLLIPDNAPFTTEQRAWLNGFLSAWLSKENPQTLGSFSSPATTPPLLVLFGSQSGNAEGLAKKIGKLAKTKNIQPRILNMEAASVGDLQKGHPTVIVTSTWGEGEMPDNAKTFWESIQQENAARLEGLPYAVLALGDKNYGDTFCYAGRQFDEQLEKLGANRLHPRIECDVDFETMALEWIDVVLGKVEKIEPNLTHSNTPSAESIPSSVLPEIIGYSSKRHFPAPFLKNQPLNAASSAKDVRHLEFSLEGSGLHYEVGDALGVMPENSSPFISEILEAAALTGEEKVEIDEKGTLSLREALTSHLELRSLLTTLPSPGTSAAQLVENLKPLKPRLYSISSSPKAHPGEVHLTVGAVRFESGGKARGGACSTFLADRLPLGKTAGVFIQTSHGFRLPTDPTRSMIMVGPGTGIAPFRAFLEEREVIAAPGKNWLFFGDQKSATDFLYRDQLEGWVKTGHLTRLDTAFSRDQSEKIYVQDRMRENASLLWNWLQEGAYFYVCGDAQRMAKDVDETLLRIILEQGSMSEEEAKTWVSTLKKEKRYQRDIY
ncbi:MAG: flavodoxin domain-containing protein [Verrucomicrobiota bacterium]